MVEGKGSGLKEKPKTKEELSFSRQLSALPFMLFYPLDMGVEALTFESGFQYSNEIETKTEPTLHWIDNQGRCTQFQLKEH